MCHVTQSFCLHFCSHLFVGPGSALYVTTDQGPSSLSLAEVSTLSWNAGRLVSFDPERNLILFVSQVQYTDILNCNFSGSLLCQCQTPSAVRRNASNLGTPAMHSSLTGSTKLQFLNFASKPWDFENNLHWQRSPAMSLGESLSTVQRE